MQRNGNRIIKALLLLLALLLSASAQPQNITGKVVGVSDGDTITYLIIKLCADSLADVNL